MRDPDLKGLALAWKVPLDPTRGGKQATTLSGWYVYAPWAHPAWSWYSVSVVHLRDIAGMPPAIKHYGHAEFELGVFAVDPQDVPDVDRGGAKLLMPPNLIWQFDGCTDEDAAQICDKVAAEIVYGASPDSDYRKSWYSLVATWLKEVGGKES